MKPDTFTLLLTFALLSNAAFGSEVGENRSPSQQGLGLLDRLRNRFGDRTKPVSDSASSLASDQGQTQTAGFNFFRPRGSSFEAYNPKGLVEPSLQTTILYDKYADVSAEYFASSVHAKNMQILAGERKGTVDPSWAYHLALAGGLDEVYSRGLEKVLEKQLKAFLEKRYALLGSFRVQKGGLQSDFLARKPESEVRQRFYKALKVLHNYQLYLDACKRAERVIGLLEEHSEAEKKEKVKEAAVEEEKSVAN